jgi:hypothetical protein
MHLALDQVLQKFRHLKVDLLLILSFFEVLVQKASTNSTAHVVKVKA